MCIYTKINFICQEKYFSILCIKTFGDGFFYIST